MEKWMGIFGLFISIASFLLGIATTKWGRSTIYDISRSLTRPLLGIRLMRMGIYDFFDSRDTLMRRKKGARVIEYLRPAKQEIGIIALSLNYSIVHQNLHEELRALLKAKPRLTVYIFLLNPNSKAVEVIASTTMRSPDELRAYINQSIEHLERMIVTFSEEEKARFHVCLHETYIANSILVVDPYDKRGRILVENYLYKIPIQESYSFECRRPDSPMFRKVRMSYERFKEDYVDKNLIPDKKRE